MLLAIVYVFGPVARMGFFVVKKTTDAELFGGGAVPARPVSGAGGFMPEDAIQPLAMFGLNG